MIYSEIEFFKTATPLLFTVFSNDIWQVLQYKNERNRNSTNTFLLKVYSLNHHPLTGPLDTPKGVNVFRSTSLLGQYTTSHVLTKMS